MKRINKIPRYNDTIYGCEIHNEGRFVRYSDYLIEVKALKKKLKDVKKSLQSN